MNNKSFRGFPEAFLALLPVTFFLSRRDFEKKPHGRAGEKTAAKRRVTPWANRKGSLTRIAARYAAGTKGASPLD
jgi:hypothetical protein